MSSTTKPTSGVASAKPDAPIGAPTIRPLDDRIGEMLRRRHHGLMRPLWADAPECVKQHWRDETAPFQTLLAACGLKIVAVEGDGRTP